MSYSMIIFISIALIAMLGAIIGIEIYSGIKQFKDK